MTKKGVVSIKFLQSCWLLLLYSIPVLLALILMLASYFDRTTRVAAEISNQEKLVIETLSELYGRPDVTRENIKEQLLKHPHIKQLLTEPTEGEVVQQTTTEKLLRFYINVHSQQNIVRTTNIDDEVRSIWLGNSIIIIIMTLFPYFMLGGTFAFSKTLNATYLERRSTVHSGLWMKLIVAIVITYGWLYIMNPTGRGDSTVEQYLIAVDFSRGDTLPLFLSNFAITPVIAAFLGWYLYLLTYFFAKMSTNDVVSSQAYGTLLQKFLFTWGITIVFVAVQVDEENANLVAFLIGFFPMAVFSLIKDKGMSIVQGGSKEDSGQLIELPGISRWQILRLEEEGINSMGSLAYHPRRNINKYLPGMAKLVDYWADIARLYTVVGPQKYSDVEQVCLTASEFVIRCGEPEFIQSLDEAGIKNPEEIARLLLRTFPDLKDDED